jgi:hypothetical protein
MAQQPYNGLFYDERTDEIRTGLIVSGMDPFILHTGSNGPKVSEAGIARLLPINDKSVIPVKINAGNPKNPARLTTFAYE